MTTPAALSPKTRWILRVLIAMAAGNLVWEVAHVPLYTLWLTGTPAEIAYAVLHCTVGDILIAAVTLGLALALFGRGDRSGQRTRTIAGAMILMAVGYTIFSEWLNIEVRGSWAYRDLMPRLPWLGTGLTPILQWIIVPALAFRFAARGTAPGP